MSYQVSIQPADIEISVSPGETLLEAASRQDISLPSGCRAGFCGSCLCTLESGEVDYPDGRPMVLQDHPETDCLTCKAVPKSDLVIRVQTSSIEEYPVRTLPCRVEKLEQLSRDVMRLWLKLPEGEPLKFHAGQYLDILHEDGRQRAFSFANAPHEAGLIELHIRHVPGGTFTDYVFSQLQEKAILRIQAPMGSFTLREISDRPLIFVAGGTGFAPIKGLIQHALHHGEQRPMTIYWGVRQQADLYLRDWVTSLAKSQPQISFIPVLSEPDADWSGRSGWVHEAVLADHSDLSGFDLYMAGPPPMIQAAKAAFLTAGLPSEHLYADAFEFSEPTQGK